VNADWVRPVPSGSRLSLRVRPRARQSAIDGVRDGRLLVRVTAPPVDRAANDAVIALLSETLAVPRRAIRIVSGETGRNKIVDIEGIAVGDVAARIGRSFATE
jgi:uncharacterized protein (TIGR00251 family)